MSESEQKKQRDGLATAAPEDRAASEGEASIEGCPVKMYLKRFCGRPIHSAATHDATPVCLMHSRDPEKSDAAFQEELEAILETAGSGIADFSGFVFPRANYRGRRFSAKCVFEDATFTQDAHFYETRFTQHAGFGGAKFTQKANFGSATFAQDVNITGATFVQDANFGHAEFRGEALFLWASFAQDADFHSATFTQDANFYDTRFTQYAGFGEAKFTQKASFMRAKFIQDADFHSATFTQDANFNYATFTRNTTFHRATFMQNAYFSGTTFTQNAYFSGATFTQDAGFSGATFTQDADFSGATFAQNADLSGATFTQNAHFSEVTFTQIADFRGTKLLGAAEFRRTRFRQDQEPLPGPIFSLVEFSQPEGVIFYKTYLGQALFHNCDVSKVNFSSVEWRKRKGSGKRMVLEEEVSPKSHDYTHALKLEEDSANERDYGLIAELYQQLKKNYDERKDYWTAGDFHYGEMEMKRLATRPAGRIYRLVIGRILGEARMNGARRWWHRHLSLVALYKYASQYGESYARPGVLFVATLVFFASLYPATGFYDPMKDRAVKTTPPPPAITYRSVASSRQSTADLLKAGLGLFGNSLLTSAEIAAFQKEPAYQPVYPWGRVLTLVEMLLTSTLAALFFLAVRRQFRR